MPCDRKLNSLNHHLLNCVNNDVTSFIHITDGFLMIGSIISGINFVYNNIYYLMDLCFFLHMFKFISQTSEYTNGWVFSTFF